MRWMIGGALLLFGMSALPAIAADGKDAAASGAPAGAATCSPCHGQNGAGQPATGIPRLAGLNAQYLERQLESFKNGTRKNRVMLMIASELSDAERKALANYYADMVTPKSETAPADPGVIAAGAKLAATGDWPNGVPACEQCHGRAGIGVGANFPRLAGQWASYIDKAIRAWKTGARKNDPEGVMANVANKLTDDQIKSVAAYYESLPVTAPANSPESKP